jgi:hypothetical protein
MPLNIPSDSWLPVTPETVSTPAARDPAVYIQCCRQFPVESHMRYRRGHMGHNETYCNIFMWDCTVALSAEIPHWYDEKTGAPTAVGKGKESSANSACAWLEKFGSTYGWNPLTPDDAIANVQSGKPTVAVWPNPAGEGHVAVVLPTTPPVRTAQAGADNFFDRPIATGFGHYPVTFYGHD